MGEIRKEIKIAAIRADVSIAYLARELGISHQNLNGQLKRGSMQYSVAKKIAKILGQDLCIK